MSEVITALGNTGVELNILPAEQVTQQDVQVAQQAAEAMGIGAEPVAPVTLVTKQNTVPEVFAAFVKPNTNGIKNDYNSSQVNALHLMERKIECRDIKLSSNEVINHILLNMATRFSLWQRYTNVYMANIIKFLDNISTGTALIEVHNNIVRFTAPDTTVVELDIKQCFVNMMQAPNPTEHIRSAGTVIDCSEETIMKIVKSIGLEL